MQSDNTYRMRCPFHEGATNPTSFAVFPNNTWYCFGCDTGGDIFRYVMERDNCGFSEAVETLCEFYNIDLECDHSYISRKTEAQRNEDMCRKFEAKQKKIYDYLKNKRGFTDETIQKYRFGWSDEFQTLVIPLINKWGQVAAFTHRFFDKLPKYRHTKNSKESDLFIKRKYWFNLVNARKLIKKNKRIIIAEGHLDVASLEQQGYAAIAYLGIVMSKEQLIALKKELEHLKGIEVVIVPDQDGKSEKFIPKVRDMFRKWWPDCNLRVALMSTFGPDIKDTNDMLVNGYDFKDVKTQHIDVFTCEYIVSTCTNVEQEYAEAQKFAQSVKSELIKADIAKMLSIRWKQDIEVVRKHLNVSVDTKEEKLREHHDIMSCMEDWEELCESEGKGIGWPELDDTLDGLRNKEIIVLSGYTSAGKSTLALKTVAHRIIRYGDNVLIFSFEMPRGAVIESLLCEIIGISQFELKEWRKDNRNAQIYAKVIEIIGKHLIVIDKSGITMQDVWEHTALANEYDFDKPISYVLIDHFHLFPNVEDVKSAADTANLIQDYVKEFNFTCMVLAQFNEESQRLSKNGKWTEPAVGNIKGSNALKAIAGTIVLAWRVYYSRLDLSEMEREEQKYITMLKVGKHRRGVKHGIYFSLEYDPKTTRMAIKQ